MSEVATPKQIMEVGEGQHRISYAYASSENATKLGKGKTGCFVLESRGKMESKGSYDDAVASAAELGTEPHRWSMDHQLNVRFLMR